MLFTNAKVFLADRGFVPAAFRVENGVYTDLYRIPYHGRRA